MPETPPRQTYFRAQADAVVLTIGILCVLGLIAGVPLIMWTTQVALVTRIVIAGTFALLALSTIDKLFFTVYELNDAELVVHSQLRRFRLPYRSMRNIKTVGFSGLVSTYGRRRFSLSLKSIAIGMADQHWQEITVSPVHSQLFINQLLAIIDTERSGRATMTRPSRRKHKKDDL